MTEWATFPSIADPHDTGAPHDIRRTWISDSNTSGSNGYLYIAFEFHNKIGDITAGSHLDSLHTYLDTNLDGNQEFEILIERNLSIYRMTRLSDGAVFNYVYGVDYADAGQRGLEFRIPYADLGLTTGSDQFLFYSSADPGGDRQPNAGTLFFNGPTTNAPGVVLAPTAAAMGQIRVAATAAGVELSWQTGAELDNAGFRVYRWTRGGWTLVGGAAGRGTTPLGGSYAIVDAEGRVGDLYAVADVSTSGVETTHPAGFAMPEALLPVKRVVGEQYRLRELGRGVGSGSPSGVSSGSRTGLGTRPIAVGVDVKIAVAEGGLVRVAREDLVAAGASLTAAPRLSFMGELVPAWWSEEGDLLFHAPAPSSPVRSADVYVLHSLGAAWAPSREVKAPTKPELRVAPSTFAESRVVEEDGAYNPAAPDEDPFTMTYVTADAPAAIPVATGGVAGATVDVTVRLRGTWDDLGLAPDHHALVQVAGTTIGEVWFDGTDAAEATATVDAALLAADGAITIVAPGDSGIPWEAFEVDEVQLDYTRARAAAGGRLTVASSSSDTIRVTGFAGPTVVLDVTDERQAVRLLGGATTGGEVRFVEKPGAFARPVPRRYLVVDASGEVAPVGVEPTSTSEAALLASLAGAEYVIVTHDELAGAAASLAAYRTTTGLDARVVSVDDVYDAFAGGNRGPDGLFALLGALASSADAPRFVVLMGAASVDARNVLGTSGPDHVPSPSIRERTRGLQAWSDELYVTGGAIPLGRIPARSAAEAQAYVDKVIAFEAQLAAEGSTDRALLVADATGATDLGFDLALDESAATVAFAATPVRVSVAAAGAPAARAQLLGELAAGNDFVAYAGHGNPLWWSSQQILTLDDAPGLAGTRAAVLLSAGCYDGYFTHPDHAPLGWALVTGPTNPHAGAVVTVASTTLVNPGVVAGFDQLVLDAVYHGGARTWGEAVLRARQRLAGGGDDVADGLATIAYLGDPALTVPTPAIETDY